MDAMMEARIEKRNWLQIIQIEITIVICDSCINSQGMHAFKVKYLEQKKIIKAA